MYKTVKDYDDDCELIISVNAKHPFALVLDDECVMKELQAIGATLEAADKKLYQEMNRGLRRPTLKEHDEWTKIYTGMGGRFPRKRDELLYKPGRAEN